MDDIYQKWLREAPALQDIITDFIKNKRNGFSEILEILQSSGSMSISKVKKIKDIIDKEQEPKDRIKTRIKKKGEYSKRKWKKRHSRKGKPEKVYTYKTLERVNVQHFGLDPDKLPTEGVIKVTFNIGNEDETYDTYGDAINLDDEGLSDL